MDSKQIPQASIDESLNFGDDPRDSDSSESEDIDFEEGPNPSPVPIQMSMPQVEQERVGLSLVTYYFVRAYHKAGDLKKHYDKHKCFVIRKLFSVFFAMTAIVFVSWSYSFTNVAVIDNYQHQFDQINGYVNSWTENYHDPAHKLSIKFGNLKEESNGGSEKLSLAEPFYHLEMRTWDDLGEFYPYLE